MAFAAASAGALAVAACNMIAGLDQDFGVAPPDARADAIRGDGASDADAPVDDGQAGPKEVRCPGDAGPQMILIPIDGGHYCIDSTEVTEAQYAAFLDSGAGFGDAQPPECSWKSTFRPFRLAPDAAESPHCRWDPGTYPDLPVVCVDWCDAYAYCHSAGKRLCGAIGTGEVRWDTTDHVDPEKDEWYRACATPENNPFPYPGPFRDAACNDRYLYPGEDGSVVNAASMEQCQGGYEGLFDMVGNAFEFVNVCAPRTNRDAAPEDDLCMVRGGSWAHPHTASNKAFSRCSGAGTLDKRSNRLDDIGFRCCATAVTSPR